VLATVVQLALGSAWATIYGTEAAVFEWPWFLAWGAGLSLAGFAICYWAARGQTLSRRVALGLIGPVGFAVTAAVAFDADAAPLSLLVVAISSSALLLPSWLGCVMARWKATS